MLGRSRWGEGGFLPGFLPPFGCGVWPALCRVRAKKSSGPTAASADIAGAIAGVRSNILIVPLIILPRGALRRQQQAFSSLRRWNTGSASRLTLVLDQSMV